LTIFPNAYKNPDSNFEFREYEDNEAPPPNLDSAAKEKVVG
jgi:hypothetical protein